MQFLYNLTKLLLKINLCYLSNLLLAKLLKINLYFSVKLIIGKIVGYCGKKRCQKRIKIPRKKQPFFIFKLIPL